MITDFSDRTVEHEGIPILPAFNSAPPTSHLPITMMGVVLLAAVKMLMKLMDVQMYSSPLIRTSSCLSWSSLAPFIHV